MFSVKKNKILTQESSEAEKSEGHLILQLITKNPDSSHFSAWPFFLLFFFFAISWATPAAYGGSRARGRIGAVATGLS